MKNILVLGAGMVSRPGIHYLLQNPDFQITVADINPHDARELIAGYDNGKACSLDVNDKENLSRLIGANEIVVSLLPWVFHMKAARLCIEKKKHLVTASYVSKEMRQFGQEVKAKKLLFLNEIGADPGIDHMSAKKIIDEVHENGGKILHYYSYTGGLPAPEDNDNPFGYKFSWNPKGAVLASKNPARFLENGRIVEIPAEELFLNYRIEHVDGLGTFEVYPNRDSLLYQELYELHEAQTVVRGTFRYPGWCETFKAIIDLGLSEEKPVKKGSTLLQMMADLTDAGANEDVMIKTAKKLGLSADSKVIQRLSWLGLFRDEPIPEGGTHLDVLIHLLREKLRYQPGEKDMLLMRHRFTVENADRTRETIISTLVEFGIPNGDSAMARTVSLPLAIGVKLMATGKINLTGIQIPTKKVIYEPVLRELENLGIKLEEKRYPA